MALLQELFPILFGQKRGVVKQAIHKLEFVSFQGLKTRELEFAAS